MRIHGELFIPKAYREDVSKWWAQNGYGDLPIVSPPDCDIVLKTQDMSTESGYCLEELLKTLGEDLSAGLLLNRYVEWDRNDYQKAELFSLSAGSTRECLDPDTVTPKARCSVCGLVSRRRSLTSGARLNRLPEYDIFRESQLWFVRDELEESLAELKGAVFKPVANTPRFFELLTNSSIGQYLGPDWGTPCSECGRQKALTPGQYRPINGLLRYSRQMWDGSDFTSDGIHVFVSRQAREILSDSKWRTPEGKISMYPVLLE